MQDIARGVSPKWFSQIRQGFQEYRQDQLRKKVHMEEFIRQIEVEIAQKQLLIKQKEKEEL
jgi:hypothetical protein